MPANLYQEIKTEMLKNMKFMDTTIKNIKGSKEYCEACIYNNAIRDAVKTFDRYRDRLEK